MKYFRTERGIFKGEKRYRDEEYGNIYEYSVVLFANPSTPIAYIPISDIIKEADTIEDLCDCFIYVKKGKHKVFESYAVNPYFDYKYKDAIYGAIWTDKGLIYVAKMNEKGELELL